MEMGDVGAFDALIGNLSNICIFVKGNGDVGNKGNLHGL